MRRLARWTLDALAALSLLLAMLCVGSRIGVAELALAHERHVANGQTEVSESELWLAFRGAEVTVFRHVEPLHAIWDGPAAGGRTWHVAFAWGEDAGTQAFESRGIDPGAAPRRGGFAFGSEFGGAWSFLAVPTWLVFACTVVWPVTRVSLVVRRWRRIWLGRCPGCGYDLRATPDKCPECGRAAAADAPAARAV